MRICRPGLPPIDDDPNAPKAAKAPAQRKILLPGSTPPARPNNRPAPEVVRGKPSGSGSPATDPNIAEAQRAAAEMAAKRRGSADKGAVIPPRKPSSGGTIPGGVSSPASPEKQS